MADFNQLYDGIHTFLNEALKAGRIDVVGFLLSKGARPDTQDGRGQTASSIAVYKSSAEGIACLVKAGASLAFKTQRGTSLLQILLKRRSNRVLKAALGALSDIDALYDGRTTPLHEVVRYNHQNRRYPRQFVVKHFLKQVGLIDLRDAEGGTLLHVAAAVNDVEMTEMLLAHYAKGQTYLDQKDCDEWSALDIAVMHSAGRVIPILAHQKLRMGIEPDQAYSLACRVLSFLSSLGDINRLLAYLTDDEIDQKDRHGQTLLHMVAKEGCTVAAHALLQRGARIDMVDENGNTPIHIAIMNEQPDILALLLRHCGPDTVNMRNSDGQTAYDLIDSIEDRFIEAITIEKLLQQYQLHYGDAQEPVAVVTDVISDDDREVLGPIYLNTFDGALPADGHLDFCQKNNRGYTLLHRAVFEREIAAAMCLIRRGASIQIKDSRGFTVFQLALQLGSLSLISALIPSNIEINEFTLLHDAVRHRNPTVINLLLVRGAQIGATDVHGQTPLHMAAGSRDANIMQTLLFCAPAEVVNQQDDRGETPLSIAVKEAPVELVIELVAAGASFTIDDGINLFEILIAARSLEFVKQVLQGVKQLGIEFSQIGISCYTALQLKRVDVIRCLIDLDISLNGIDEDGKTPLHHAAQDGHVEIVRKLISLGIPVEIPDRDGNTPLQVAAIENKPEIVACLLPYCSQHYVVLARKVAEERNLVKIKCLLLKKEKEFTAKNLDIYETLLIELSNKGQEKLSSLLRSIIFNNSPEIDVDRVNDSNRTLLHEAVAAECFKAMKGLISMGACLDIKDSAGETPFSLALRQNSSLLFIELLLTAVEDINVLYDGQRTLLDDAVRYGRADVVGVLLHRGAVCTIASADGITPLARAESNSPIKTMLVESMRHDEVSHGQYHVAQAVMREADASGVIDDASRAAPT